MGVILSYKNFLKTYKTRGYRIKHLEKYRYLFPLKANPSLAGIIGDLMGDGHLQGDPKWRIDFTSKSINELKRFEREMKNLFGKTGKIRECVTNKYSTTYNLGINSSPITRILFLCGVPSGQKVLTSYNIPKWIKEDKRCFKRFCQRFFSCEGGIMHEATRKYPQIRLDVWKSENLINNGLKFVRDICDCMYNYFKVESKIIIQKKINLRKDGIITKPIRIYIFNESVIKFYNKIGFEGDKQKSLKALISK